MVTYTTLTQDIQDWTENDDSEFTNEIPVLIALTEERIFRDAPFLPIFKGTDTGNTVSGTETITLDSTTRTIRALSITVSSAQVILHQRMDSYLRDYAPNTSTTGQPKLYARSSETAVILAPVPDAIYPYTFLVTKQPAGLTASNATTWLGTNAADLVFFACLIEAYGFMKNPEAMALWTERYGAALASLQNEMGRNITNESTAGA